MEIARTRLVAANVCGLRSTVRRESARAGRGRAGGGPGAGFWGTAAHGNQDIVVVDQRSIDCGRKESRRPHQQRVDLRRWLCVSVGPFGASGGLSWCPPERTSIYQLVVASGGGSVSRRDTPTTPIANTIAENWATGGRGRWGQIWGAVLVPRRPGLGWVGGFLGPDDARELYTPSATAMPLRRLTSMYIRIVEADHCFPASVRSM